MTYVPTPQELGKRLVWRIDQSEHSMHFIEQLLKQGADLTTKSAYGHSPLMMATYHGKTEVVSLLLDYNPPLEQTDNFGATALIEAARWNFTDILALLLKRGARTDIRDNEGRTALIWAAMEGREEIVRLLLDSNADIDILDGDKKSALDHARIGKFSAIVQMLEDRQKELKDKAAAAIKKARAQKRHIQQGCPLKKDMKVRPPVKIKKRPSSLRV